MIRWFASPVSQIRLYPAFVEPVSSCVRSRSPNRPWGRELPFRSRTTQRDEPLGASEVSRKLHRLGNQRKVSTAGFSLASLAGAPEVSCGPTLDTGLARVPAGRDGGRLELNLPGLNAESPVPRHAPWTDPIDRGAHPAQHDLVWKDSMTMVKTTSGTAMVISRRFIVPAGPSRSSLAQEDALNGPEEDVAGPSGSPPPRRGPPGRRCS